MNLCRPLSSFTTTSLNKPLRYLHLCLASLHLALLPSLLRAVFVAVCLPSLCYLCCFPLLQHLPGSSISSPRIHSICLCRLRLPGFSLNRSLERLLRVLGRRLCRLRTARDLGMLLASTTSYAFVERGLTRRHQDLCVRRQHRYPRPISASCYTPCCRLQILATEPDLARKSYVHHTREHSTVQREEWPLHNFFFALGFQHSKVPPSRLFRTLPTHIIQSPLLLGRGIHSQ